MVAEQKATEKGVVKADAEGWVEPEPVADVVARPWLNLKKNQSLIPPKRKLVKRMMFDSIVCFIASIFATPGSSTFSGVPINQGSAGGRANVGEDSSRPVMTGV